MGGRGLASFLCRYFWIGGRVLGVCRRRSGWWKWFRTSWLAVLIVFLCRFNESSGCFMTFQGIQSVIESRDC